MKETVKIRGIKSIFELGSDRFVIRPPCSLRVESRSECLRLLDAPQDCEYTSLDFAEISVTTLRDVIYCWSGVVISNDGYVVRETLEGGLAENGINLNDAQDWEMSAAPHQVVKPILAASKLGTFNYSLFLHEILPSIYIAGFDGRLEGVTIPIHFPDFVSAHFKSTVLKLASTFCAREQFEIIPEANFRAKLVYVVSAGHAARMPRIKRIMPSLAAELATLRCGGHGPAQKIYILRETKVPRTLSNRREIIEHMRSRGFLPVELADLSFDAQADLFSSARMIVAEHGAALANLWFAKRGTKVVECFPEPLVGRWIYRDIARLTGLTYVGASFPTPVGWQWDKDEIHLPVETIDRALDVADAM